MAERPVRVTPLSGLVDRLVGKLADRVAPAIASRLTPEASAPFQATYFGPGTPLVPREPPGTAPREWQYPPGVNIYTTPRGSEPIGFQTLLNLADNCDMVRICIEMRKEQVVGLDWDIVARVEGEGDRYVTEIATAKAFFARPDREHAWDTWLRICLEDVLVLDALSLYRRRTRAGQLFALEPIDGATIKPLLDGYGRTPAAPAPAYQQILYGVPHVDLTAEELLYRPKNQRARSAYGSSPVEWIILTVNWYLRRQMFNLSYYTDGNVPEGFGTVPEGWTPDQIRQFQEWFDALLSGNDPERRKIRFVGNGFNLTRLREMNFEVAFEEWLARVITAAFQVSYQRFIQRVVRATAEQASAEQADTGLDPLKLYISGIVDEVLVQDLGFPFLRHAWMGGEQADEQMETTKRTAYVAAGILTRDEVREVEGYTPFGLPMTSEPTVTTPAGPVPLVEPEPAPVPPAPQAGGAAPNPADAGAVAQDKEPAEPAAAQKAAMAVWRRKAVRAFREGKAERALEFESKYIPPAAQAAVRRRLAAARTVGDAVAAFEVAASPFCAGREARGSAAGAHGLAAALPYP
jgi:hypothetical protein